MRVLITLIFLSCISSLAVSQSKNGVVVNEVDNLPIEGAHIVNVSSNNMAISNTRGEFSLVSNSGDTVIVSNINFKTKHLVVSDEKVLEIRLNPAEIQLDEVVVSNMPATQADFRRELLEMHPEEQNKLEIEGLMKIKSRGSIPKNYDPNYTNSVAYAIRKPISFIAKKLSKSHKSKVKYYQTVANRSTVIMNSKKYNAEIVQELTGLKDDSLIDFMQFLDFDSAFVERSTEYEIAARILLEFDEYKQG